MKELNQKLAVVQTELKAKKSSYNSFGKYYFRKSEDILEAIKPFLVKHGVTVTINEELMINDFTQVPMMKSTATFSDGENAIHATALVGVDLNQKGMQTAQQFGKGFFFFFFFVLFGREGSGDAFEEWVLEGEILKNGLKMGGCRTWFEKWFSKSGFFEKWYI